MKAVPMEIVSRTNKGLVRSINEDSIAILPDFGLAILADGMGGYEAGEVASQLAVQNIAKELIMVVQNPSVGTGYQEVEDAVRAANQAIFDAVATRRGSEGMATTIVVAVFADERVIFAHLGDSRLYRFAEGTLEQLTSDHSIVQELVDQGMFFSIKEAMEAGVPNNVLTRGLGVETQVRLDIGETPLEPGDVFLLCSDGLTNMVSDTKIAKILGETQGNLEGAADWLLKDALEAGGLDNVSLVLARLRG
jgi:protein phosphatase